MTGIELLKTEINRRMNDLGFMVDMCNFPADGHAGDVTFVLKRTFRENESVAIKIPEHIQTINLTSIGKFIDTLA